MPKTTEMSRPKCLKMHGLFCFLLVLLEVHSKKQSKKTCSALETLMESGHSERIGSCIKNRECTSITCTAELTQPTPNTAMSVITFDPCSEPVSVHIHVNSTILKGMPLLNNWVSQTTSVQATPAPLGKFNVTLDHRDGGVKFGVVHKSDFDPLPVTLFPRLFIPLICLGSEKHPVKSIKKKSLVVIDNKGDNSFNLNEFTDADNVLPPDLGGNIKIPSDINKVDTTPASSVTAASGSVAAGVANETTTEPGPRVRSIHQVLMIIVLLGIVILHLALAVINIIACVKF